MAALAQHPCMRDLLICTVVIALPLVLAVHDGDASLVEVFGYAVGVGIASYVAWFLRKKFKRSDCEHHDHDE